MLNVCRFNGAPEEGPLFHNIVDFVSCWKIQNWVKPKKGVDVVGREEGTFSEAEAVLSDHWKMEKNTNNTVKP